jgi:site-specific recombinase
MDPAVTLDTELQKLLAEALPGGSAFWLERLLVWLRAAPTRPLGAQSPRTARLTLLLDSIAAHPQRDVLVERLHGAWSSPTVIRLLAETGLPSQLSLSKEMMHRFANRILPRFRTPDNLPDLLSRLGLTEDDAQWIGSLDGETLERATALVATPKALLLRAAQLVAVRVASVGTSGSILNLRPADELLESAFMDLPPMVRQLRAALASGGEPPDWQAEVARCRRILDEISRLIDKRGASTETLYHHELLGAELTRLAVLLNLALDTGLLPAREVGMELVRAIANEHSFGAVGRAEAKRLALKITEYTGSTGEHYVVRSRKEWWANLRAGAWGGCVTAFTALAKFGLAALPLAPVVLGLGLTLNYTLSFWILQIFHFALSSKQPAMTASAMAASLADKSDMEHNVELIASISRSQAAVTISNVVATASLAMLLDWLVHLATGRWFLPVPDAEHALHSLNPVATLTVVYATITGLFLWLSSLAAGAASNWSAYRRLPEATREDARIKRLFGKPFALKLGDFVEHNLGGMIGYAALGFLLGFVPVLLSRFFGIALEVRHVTLHAAAAAYGILPLRDAGLLVTPDLVWAAAGIGVIGFCNFTVSAWLALLTATRARDLTLDDRRVLWRAIRRAFFENPARFFWIPAKTRRPFEMPAAENR